MSALAPCAFCKGRVEEAGRGRYNKLIIRCVSCGREPEPAVAIDASRAPTVASVLAARAQAAAGSQQSGGAGPCTAAGCPGTRLSSGHCACCARRAAWAEANLPERKCEICEGRITGHARLIYCKACKPIAHRVVQAKAGAQKTKKAS